MAGQTIIYKGIQIGTGSVRGENIVESAEVTITPDESQIEDGQTVYNRYDITFAVNLYNDDVLDPTEEPNVRTDCSSVATKTDITFSGAVGAADVKITDVIINGTKVFDQPRVAARLTGSKSAVTLDNTVNVTTAS